jgi:hypothetical protein
VERIYNVDVKSPKKWQKSQKMTFFQDPYFTYFCTYNKINYKVKKICKKFKKNYKKYQKTTIFATLIIPWFWAFFGKAQNKLFWGKT